jgi:hypothetical protein|tara:strand:- start:1131 stop:1322 length:192 start_codon:yes stop_codon:yes gene_type:complete
MLNELNLHGVQKITINEHRSGLDITVINDKDEKFVLSCFSSRLDDANKKIIVEMAYKFIDNDY